MSFIADTFTYTHTHTPGLDSKVRYVFLAIQLKEILCITAYL